MLRDRPRRARPAGRVTIAYYRDDHAALNIGVDDGTPWNSAAVVDQGANPCSVVLPARQRDQAIRGCGMNVHESGLAGPLGVHKHVLRTMLVGVDGSPWIQAGGSMAEVAHW